MDVLSLVRQGQSTSLAGLTDPAVRSHYGPGGLTPLMVAAEAGSAEVVTYLVRQRGVSVDDRSADGKTALTFASMNGRAEVAEVLLDLGADPNAADEDGLTPLMHNAFARRPESVGIATLLLRKGADPEIRDKTGKTASDWVGPRRGHWKVPFVGEMTTYGPVGPDDPLRRVLDAHQGQDRKTRP